MRLCICRESMILTHFEISPTCENNPLTEAQISIRDPGGVDDGGWIMQGKEGRDYAGQYISLFQEPQIECTVPGIQQKEDGL